VAFFLLHFRIVPRFVPLLLFALKERFLFFSQHQVAGIELDHREGLQLLMLRGELGECVVPKLIQEVPELRALRHAQPAFGLVVLQRLIARGGRGHGKAVVERADGVDLPAALEVGSIVVTATGEQ